MRRLILEEVPVLKWFVAGGTLLLLLVVGAGWLESRRTPNPIVRAWHANATEWAQTRVMHALRDPSSAAFQGLRKHRIGGGFEITAVAICGEVNGRNGFGGMTGFTRFVVQFSLTEGGAVSAGPVMLDEGRPAQRMQFDRLWEASCASTSRIG